MTSSRAQLARFAIAGALSNAALYALYLLLTAAGVWPKAAMTASFTTGVLLAYSVQRNWTFRSDAAHRSAVPRFVGLYTLLYGLNWLILWVFVDVFMLQHQLVQGVAVIVIACLSFLLQRLWVFGPDRRGVPS